MSLPDTIFIFGLALVIFGPKKLPEIGRQMGKLLYEFRRASNEFKLQIEEELRAADDAARENRAAINSAVALDAESESQSIPPASVTSHDTSELSGDLTVRPPTTGEPVSAENPAHAYSSTATTEESAGTESGSGLESQVDEDWNEDWNTYQEYGGEEDDHGQNSDVTAASDGAAAAQENEREYRHWDRNRSRYEDGEDPEPASFAGSGDEPFQWECSADRAATASAVGESAEMPLEIPAEAHNPGIDAEKSASVLDESVATPSGELEPVTLESFGSELEAEPLTAAAEQPAEQAANHHA